MKKTATKAHETARIGKGVWSLYPGKVRAPLVFTAPTDVRVKLEATVKRAKASRSDVICYLIDEFGDKVPGGLGNK
jgi:hypothetical protein